ncbi:hypothetical protein ELQ35_13730 [Peribacillus cavernae]|uniref:Uncharacterized protein n=1 Tax=Peribacillus cavernae TaxID=1674310 RepID=A0A433HIP9_9BACI|nr:DUF5316 family protein [Peribacillus cavernae]MDQ0217837.1 hypothetical protein [Peribacillus cavernae]RUQ28281.1 hypothetical protein ELQ35_13730 [Peribacillus cavernae]
MSKIILITGVVLIAFSGIFLGAWVSGDQQRGNFYSETKENRFLRTKISLWSGGLGLLCLAIWGLIYY